MIISAAALAALSIATSVQVDLRILIATTPVAEVRSDAGWFCTTPCIVSRKSLGSKLTISRNGERDVFFDPHLPPTPVGGVFDPAQNLDFETSKQFIFLRLGPTGKDINDTPDRLKPKN